MKTFRVGTFMHGKRVHCYTLWYSPEWDGCIEYDVEAETGAEAKKKAAALRRAEPTFEVVSP
jgi:hypothetical protein